MLPQSCSFTSDKVKVPPIKHIPALVRAGALSVACGGFLRPRNSLINPRPGGCKK